MRVLVAGGGGVISRRLITLLVESGHEVIATTRSEQKLPELGELGAEPAVCDALEGGALETLALRASPEVIVNQLTALPARLNPRRIAAELEATNLLRRFGSRAVMRAASSAGARLVVAQSVAFAYAPGPGLASEEDPLYLNAPGGFAEPVAAIMDLEQATLGDAEVEGIPTALSRRVPANGPVHAAPSR